MNSFGFLILLMIYSVGLFIFGNYIKLVEIAELIMCFACKEMGVLEPVYDYIIVGCGTAGSIMALRLAEDKHLTVLVVEAGPHGSALFDVPAFTPVLQQSTIDWRYQTIPQKDTLKAFQSQTSRWPMGRIVGGTGRLNSMVYFRGHPKDYKAWFKDAPNFDYETDVLAYFKKAENQRGLYKNDTKYHGSNGPLVVEDLSFVSPLAEVVLKAAKVLGYSVTDLNGKNNVGFMQIQVNSRSGARWTPAYALLEHSKPNITFQTHTLVHKVLLKSNYEAYAIKCTHLGQESLVRARRAIILSAGVIGSAKLLMHSGIGPKQHLAEVGIKSKIDLPVGNNLQDHVTTGLDLVLLNTSLGVSLGTMMSPYTVFNYFYNSSGLWTLTGAEVLGVLHANSKTCCDILDNFLYNKQKKKAANKQKLNLIGKYLPSAQRYKAAKIVTDVKHNITSRMSCLDRNQSPDLQILVLPIGLTTDGGRYFRNAMGIKEKTWLKYFVPLVGTSVASFLPIVLHPRSRGTVRLSNKDVYSSPLINPNYLSDPYDIQIILKGIEVIKELIETEPMQVLGAKLNPQPFPGCESFKFDTQAYWECYVRHLTLTVYHPAGTCKMGLKQNDAVVGFDFRVHGTNKLYVVDASVFPTLPSSNPNAAVAMLAEKAADELKLYNYQSRHFCRRREVLLSKRVCQRVK